jgi:putative transposase
MGSVGDAYDNAMCESFFATLECELLDRGRFKTQTEARSAVFAFIEGFYNPRRRHSSIGYLSPVDYEHRHHAATVDRDAPPACRRARGRQGQALRATAESGRP